LVKGKVPREFALERLPNIFNEHMRQNIHEVNVPIQKALRVAEQVRTQYAVKTSSLTEKLEEMGPNFVETRVASHLQNPE
jgi:SPX domain protein involved in polyphosphate accumulation